jgi:hypothetical protein
VENQVYVVTAGNTGFCPGVANFDQQYAESAVLTPCDDAISAFAADGVAQGPEDHETRVDHQKHDPDGPEDRNLKYESENEENDSERDQGLIGGLQSLDS